MSIMGYNGHGEWESSSHSFQACYETVMMAEIIALNYHDTGSLRVQYGLF